MLIKFSVKNLFTRRRRSITCLAGISISIALFISIILVLKNAQSAFIKPLQEAGSDMIVQLQGEPCVWSIVKLPTNLNPIPLQVVAKIKSLNEVITADGALITWAFSAPGEYRQQRAQSPIVTSRNDTSQPAKNKSSGGQPCNTGTPGSFCETGEHPAKPADFKPIVVVGVNPESGEIGPIKKSEVKNIQGRSFTKDDNYVAILDKDFARTRGLKVGDSIDIGQRLDNIIVGIIDSGYDARVAGAQIFIPLKTAIEMTGRGDIVDIIFVKLKGGVDVNAVKQKIRKILGNDSATITTSEDYLSSVAGLSNLAHGLMLAVFFIVILISFLFISKTAFTSVLERSSEIGVLKAVGWRNQDVMRLIVLENSILGFLGGLIGSVLGYLVSFIYKANLSSALPYYLNPYPPCSQYLVKTLPSPNYGFPISIFLSTILLAVVIQVLSGVLAIRRVLKLWPIDAAMKL